MILRILSTSLAALALISCGDSAAPAEPDPNVTQITLTADNRFSPADVTVDPGTTVRWVSATATPHTITPDAPGTPGVWVRVATASTGTVLTHTFTESGQTYPYHCEPHLAEGMTGIIRVR